MKKIVLSIFLVASVMSSCSDAYEISQPGYVTDESLVFATPKDVQRGVRALYAVIPAEAEVQFASFYTDELGIGLNNLGQGINDGSYQFNLISNNDYANAIWANYYNLINRANRIISRTEVLMKDAEKVNNEADLTEYKTSLAELYALRAFSHFKLFAYFTPNYIDPNGLSVIKFDFLQTDDYKRFEKRATVAEITSFIESDINKVKDLLKPANSGDDYAGFNNADTGYVTNAMVESILIKMYSMLQNQNAYEKLETSFNILVDNYAKNIDNPNSYAAMFSSGIDDSEAIFRKLRISTDGSVTSGVASAWYPSEVSADAQVYMEIGRSLYNELDKLDPNQTGNPLHDFDSRGEIVNTYSRLDARYIVGVLEGSKVAPNYKNLSPDEYRSNDVLRIGKYPGITNRPLMNDIWIFRFTDMLLALAEKRANDNMLTGTVALGDYSNVESIIYNIRAHRNTDESFTPLSMPTNFSSQREAFARILEERRVEFAFEGHRYLDMKRLGVRAGSPGFVRDEKDCVNVCSLEPTSFKLTLPIPRPEILANPNMTQNDGY